LPTYALIALGENSEVRLGLRREFPSSLLRGEMMVAEGIKSPAFKARAGYLSAVGSPFTALTESSAGTTMAIFFGNSSIYRSPGNALFG
jgi:hypothetical protein